MNDQPFTTDWFNHLLEKQGLKQVDLYEFSRRRGTEIGADKISKIANGKRAIQRSELSTVWDFFKLDPAGLGPAIGSFLKTDNVDQTLGVRSPLPNAGLPEPLPISRERLPIKGAAVGGDPNGKLLFNGQQLGSVDRPESLVDVPDAYAVYFHGDSMLPRYEAGERGLVNPHAPYRSGHYVVAQIHDNDDDPPYAYVKKFISFNEKELVLEQLNPSRPEERIMRFPKRSVLTVHKIVGALD